MQNAPTSQTPQAAGYGKCETAGCTCTQFVAKSGSAFQTCTCGHRDVAHEL